MVGIVELGTTTVGLVGFARAGVAASVITETTASICARRVTVLAVGGEGRFVRA